MTTQQYIDILKNRFKSGISHEHSYRGDLETLIRTLVNDVEITNEPSIAIDCGNPDYVITNGKIPVGYIEAKDIGKDLNSKQYKEQFNRYKKALDNLIITDYIYFKFFQHGELVHEIRIAEIKNNSIEPIPENFSQFENLIQDFCTFIGITIKSSKRLAVMMAAKARLLQNILERAVNSDEETQENTSLKGQYDTFKQILIHDLTPKGFADIYAQTLAYGMFAARLHDTTLNDFSRQEAAELIPKSNPFLRKLFQYVAGYDIDERIKTTVDNLADVFRATNIEAMLKNFGKSTQTYDPIIHFYETFLSEYDPKLRKSRGVWYTPQPVVNFIVRAVDEVLKTEFDLPQGLADTTKTKISVRTQSKDKRTSTGYKEVQQEVHKVQILDPATGTGTFLAEVVKFIYNSKFSSMQGAWSTYVDEHLIPRLNGFELLMASYAMAHLKLDMLLTETGYKASKEQRFNIYLTNSLEEHHPDTGTLFSNWLSSEANEANHIKRDTPVMCVIGNPPYSVSSTNKGEWILNLIADYKKNLNERKINLDDDYIKFIRYGQYHIEKNGSGILAYISNNSFLDGVTQREMRKNLLNTFDKIYILDLHGDVKKLLKVKDENVFDIQQGVSINIFVKTSKRNTNSKFHYSELIGSRLSKYNFLNENSIYDIKWSKPKLNAFYSFFNVVGNKSFSQYEKGFKITELFSNYNSGIQTKNDSLLVQYEKEKIEDLVSDVKTLEVENLRNKYQVKEGAWTWENAKSDVATNSVHIIPIQYRPFDYRYIGLTKKSSGLLGRPRYSTTKHFIGVNNIGLICNRQCIGDVFSYIGVTDKVTAHGTFYLGNRGQDYLLPLYLYAEKNQQKTLQKPVERTPNLNPIIVTEIEQLLRLTFTKEKEQKEKTFAPIDILDYIYAVLHSPSYREQKKEFLKIDFPRVPYPNNKEIFWQLVKLGGELRQIHLLESPLVNKPITQYPVDGDNIVTKITNMPICDPPLPADNLRAYINESQYFDNIPEVAWNFYIGGYQPAQKWLKDRKNRKLEFEDIQHYQKIIVALTETDKLMKKIDTISFD